jgi:hypothetical protein
MQRTASVTSIVVGGALANKLGSGGEAWVRLSWLRGLQRLGVDVFFVEQIDAATCVDTYGDRTSFEASMNAAYFEKTAVDYGLAARASLLLNGSTRTVGCSLDEVTERISTADAVVNISGHLDSSLLASCPLRAFVDIDPGFTQFWHEQGLPGARLPGHNRFFTIAENIGAPDCAIPQCGLTWQVVRQPVVIEDWPVTAPCHTKGLTSVASWRGAYGPIEHDGRRYGVKAHEFRKLASFPEQVSPRCELALHIDDGDRADRELLESHGWNLVDPLCAAGDPGLFRSYVQASSGEISAASGVYVDTRSGWFSDRSIRYLASGRPVLVQDTGFTRNYDSGEGLVAFRTLDEAVLGALSIHEDYDRHSVAARELAVELFDSDRVLAAFLNVLGVR